MVEVKVSELSGAALRYAVATACGLKVRRLEEGDYKPDEPHWWMVYNERRVTAISNGLVGYIKPRAKGITGIYDYCPDDDWRCVGPLIEQYDILICPPEDEDGWEASVEGDCDMHFGETPLIAACRAIVAAKLGDTVSVPKELLS